MPREAPRSQRVAAQRLHDPDRRAGGRRHASPGTHHARRRRGRGRRRRPGSATPTPMRAIVALIDGQARRDGRADATRSTSPARCAAMQRAVRNLGRAGLAATRDLGGRRGAVGSEGEAARPAARALLGRCRDAVPIYGSGGFTTYTDERAARAARRLGRARRLPLGEDEDRHAIPSATRTASRVAKAAIGDAGAVRRRQRRLLGASRRSRFAERFARRTASRWFEEPVSSDDLAGLRLLRERAPAGMEIAAGEYGYTLDDFAPHAARPARSTCCRPT